MTLSVDLSFSSPPSTNALYPLTFFYSQSLMCYSILGPILASNPSIFMVVYIFSRMTHETLKTQVQLEMWVALLCLVIQSRLNLCEPVDCGQPGSSVHGDSPGRDVGNLTFLPPL